MNPRSGDTDPGTVLITGGADGIGFATASEFAGKGYSVGIIDRNPSKGVHAMETLVRTGAKVFFAEADVSDEDSIHAAIDKIVKSLGELSVVVNNAGIFLMRGIDATKKEWDQILSVNVIGMALVAKCAVPSLRKFGKGSIVNVSSIAGLIGYPQFVTYSASKGAIISMTRCMAVDLAQYNIRVNAISPGAVWTETNQKFMREHYGFDLDRQGADAHPAIGGKQVLNRISDPAEIAKAIYFLASKEASFITGENLVVDGGSTII